MPPSGDTGGGLGGFVVEYRYEAAGSPRWGTCVFLRAQSIRPGDRLDVWFDPQDPDVSVWPGAPGGGPGDWLLGAVTGWRLFVLLAVVLLGVAVFQGGAGWYVLYLALVGSLVFLGGVTVWDFTGHWELAAAIEGAYARLDQDEERGQPAEPPPSRDHRMRRERRQGRARHRRR